MKHLATMAYGVAISSSMLSTTVQAQPEIEALLWFNGGGTARGALNSLNYTYERAVGETRFIEAMRRKSWDLVVWDLPYATFTQRETTLQLLEEHIAAGGRLFVNYNNLDSWPELQTLLGVENAEEVLVSKDVTKTDPIHPSFPRNHYRSGNPAAVQMWSDAGDWLWPSIDGEVAGIFQNGEPAIVVSNNGQTLVNGFDWDSYSAGSSFAVDQIKYIMSCKADLDQSTGVGVLDIFDFLEFQDLFVKQDPLANMVFDSSFDIFDFLAFQEAFVNGCV